MKTPAIQNAILAHLKAVARAESSRDLAARFLRIEHGDEETCRRLLAPFLLTVPGVIYRAGEGWSLSPGRARGAIAAGAERAPGGGPKTYPRNPPPTPAAPLRSFVALASDGAGPGGSGGAHAVSLLPVIDGEECQVEHLPAWLSANEGPPAEGSTGFQADDLRALIEAVGDLPVVCHRIGREVEPIRRVCAEAGLEFGAPVVSLAKLGHLLLGLKSNHATLDLAAALAITARGPDDCRGRVAIVAAAFLRVIPMLEERGIDSLETLLEYQDMPAAPLDLSTYSFSARDLKALPTHPGVYRFLDRSGKVIYVGKAKNLRSRVGSYFAPSARGTAKGRAILEQVHSLQIEVVASELEAALLEAALLSEHHPGLNRQFEVGERTAPYGPRLNLVVVLADACPGADGRTCTLHLLRAGRYLERVRGVVVPFPGRSGPEPQAWSGTISLIASAYFGRSGPARRERARVSEEPGVENRGAQVDWQLVSSFLRKHRDEVNVLDVDECSSPAEAAGRLRVLVEATTAGRGRVVAR